MFHIATVTRTLHPELMFLQLCSSSSGGLQPPPPPCNGAAVPPGYGTFCSVYTGALQSAANNAVLLLTCGQRGVFVLGSGCFSLLLCLVAGGGFALWVVVPCLGCAVGLLLEVIDRALLVRVCMACHGMAWHGMV